MTTLVTLENRNVCQAKLSHRRNLNTLASIGKHAGIQSHMSKESVECEGGKNLLKLAIFVIATSATSNMSLLL